MQISGSSFSTLPVLINRRDELSDRRQGDRRQSGDASVVETVQSGSARGEVTRIRTRSSSDAQNAGAQSYKFTDFLNSRTRTALQAYSNNSPSIEERLGVDLAGVDTYA